MPKSTMPAPLEPQELTIELVPSTCWFTNVRSNVSPTEWNKCKRFVRARSQDQCEVCGGRGPKWPVECHEIWRFDLPTETQILDGLIALCPDCHEVKHMGFADVRGRAAQAIEHLAKVRGWSIDDAILYAQSCFELWAARSQYEWALDISWLATIGVTPPDTIDRTPMTLLRNHLEGLGLDERAGPGPLGSPRHWNGGRLTGAHAHPPPI